MSSSLLPMLDADHRSAAPESAYVGEEAVDVLRLDDALAGSGRESSDRLCIKLDCQGYEREVLDGAAGQVRQTVMMVMELSLVDALRGCEFGSTKPVPRMRDDGLRARERSIPCSSTRARSSCCRSTAASSPFPADGDEARPRLRPRWRTQQRTGASGSRRRHSTRCRCTTTCSSPASSFRGPICSSTKSD